MLHIIHILIRIDLFVEEMSRQSDFKAFSLFFFGKMNKRKNLNVLTSLFKIMIWYCPANEHWKSKIASGYEPIYKVIFLLGWRFWLLPWFVSRYEWNKLFKANWHLSLSNIHVLASFILLYLYVFSHFIKVIFILPHHFHIHEP